MAKGNSVYRSTPTLVTSTKRLTVEGVESIRLLVPTQSVLRGPFSPSHLQRCCHTAPRDIMNKASLAGLTW